ncbi:MAG: HlyD family secretion protein [Opitutaceae bacterium]|nr:HlyD family secretion protein [Opitutaceae bacterium]
MDLILLGIYSFFVWLIFFKFKWLPWNITSQVIVVTIPIIALATLILSLNVVAPSSHDVRVINYYVQIVPRVAGRVVEVPVEPNRHIKKGEVLMRIDPTPFEIDVRASEANLRSLQEQLKGTVAGNGVTAAQLDLAKRRLKQYTELAGAGAGNKFDAEEAETQVLNLESQTTSSTANEDKIKAQIAQAEAQLAEAKWKLEQTTIYAPADGTVVNLQTRVGSYAVPLAGVVAMTFVEDEQWVMAFYKQNELRKVKPGQEAEIALRTYPGRVIKCKVESVVWASGEGMLPIAGMVPNAQVQEGRFPVRLVVDEEEKELFLAAGARGQGTIYTDSGKFLHVMRKVIIRVGSKTDWLIVKLH